MHHQGFITLARNGLPNPITINHTDIPFCHEFRYTSRRKAIPPTHHELRHAGRELQLAGQREQGHQQEAGAHEADGAIASLMRAHALPLHPTILHHHNCPSGPTRPIVPIPPHLYHCDRIPIHLRHPIHPKGPTPQSYLSHHVKTIVLAQYFLCEMGISVKRICASSEWTKVW